MERQVAQSSHPSHGNPKGDSQTAELGLGCGALLGWGVGRCGHGRAAGSGTGVAAMQTAPRSSRLLLEPQAAFRAAPLGGWVCSSYSSAWRTGGWRYCAHHHTGV